MKNIFKFCRSNFCTSESKNLFFRFNNIEYKAVIPKDTKRTVQEFLDLFGKEKGNLSSQDFEVFKNDKYISNDTLINDITTKTLEENPLTVVEDKFTCKNIRYRKLGHLKEPLNVHSQIFQQFLNEFIKTNNIGASDINSEAILRYYKTMSKVTSTNTKFSNLLSLVLKAINLRYDFDHTLGLKEFNKHDETELLIINSKNGLKIPITMVLSTDATGSKDSDFNESALNNLNVLRKMCMKNKTDFNFGIVTDLYKWKFNYYQKPADKHIEGDSNFMLSLKYDLPITNHHINTNALAYILKIVNGITTSDIKGLNFQNGDKKHIH
jgi:hypothetical protein